uniref:Uncharacterized protein n=1 Tax=Chromera velia CCMP2878 TaxID=1169474 RepID=A0A0G4HNH4_9ALVE|eukprot:Cvel_7620.t1-p1 / transcript=Cvel_7620.t1 / gene=Cvel_7620 / organism=Chromera_velia_CCMP2878 / gene_product=hypothetical protein / transcript_product=hypothetical protein / location=Cvel_scaffold402:30532-30924(-) / protein_length=131 / sequence_SO=supercontig / SO=protein_coding / is_pseudo=false
MPVLKTLKLRGGLVRREGMVALTEVLRVNPFPMLNELELTENWINSTHVTAFAVTLVTDSLPNLRLLNLANTQVGEKGGKALAEAMNEGKLQVLRQEGRLMLSMAAAEGFKEGTHDCRCLKIVLHDGSVVD